MNNRHRLIWLWVLVIGVCIAIPVWAQQSIGPDDFREMQAKEPPFVLIDVRTAAEFQAQHIRGAVNIPSPILLKAKLSKTKPLVVYCGNAACQMAHNAAKTLAANGYDNVSVLEGGLDAWNSKSYPVRTSKTGKAPQADPVKRMSARMLNDRLGEEVLLVLDVRPAAEYRAGHLPGAVNVPLEDLASRLDGMDQVKQVIVYDRTSRRSRQAAGLLQEHGFSVMELNGGIPVWTAMKFPIEI